MKFNPMAWAVLNFKFGTSKNITRPSLSDLSYSASVSQASRAEGEIGNVSIGNPELKPFEHYSLPKILSVVPLTTLE